MLALTIEETIDQKRERLKSDFFLMQGQVPGWCWCDFV
jgi:hypothetical protein